MAGEHLGARSTGGDQAVSTDPMPDLERRSPGCRSTHRGTVTDEWTPEPTQGGRP